MKAKLLSNFEVGNVSRLRFVGKCFLTYLEQLTSFVERQHVVAYCRCHCYGPPFGVAPVLANIGERLGPKHTNGKSDKTAILVLAFK
jgi:hypothetical protein